MPTADGSTSRRQSAKSPASILNSPPPKMSARRSRSSVKSPGKSAKASSDSGSRRSSGVLSPSSRANIQADMTADSSLIGKLLEDLMPTKGTSEVSKSPDKPPAPMERPSQVLSRRLSHHRRRSSLAAPADENEDPGMVLSQPEQQKTGRESLGSVQHAGRDSLGSLLDMSTSAPSPSNRRQTADASQLDQIWRDLLSPNSRSRLSNVGGSGRRGGQGRNRRDTADPEALRLLIDELRSPSADKSTLGRVLTHFGCSPTQVAELGNVTVDASMLGRFTEDLDALLNASDDAIPAPSSPAAAPARTAPSGADRRETADPCSLAALGLGSWDESMSSLQSLPAAPPSSGKKTKTPPPKNNRRDTASPGVLAELLGEFADPDDSGAHAMQVSQEMGRSSATKKSPRLTRTNSVPTPAHAPPSPSSSFTEQAMLNEFSMSPPRAPASARRGPLRSCLSSKRKTRPEPSSPAPPSAKKVVFGSPNAAMFYKNSPSNSLTPMNKREVQHHFPQLHGLPLPGQHTIDEEVEEVEEGVTAQNSAILAAFEANDGSDDESAGTGGSTSSSKRKRVSRSPRPKRRQSLLMSAGSSGFYGIRDDEEEGEEGGHEQGPPRPQRLSAMEMRDDEDDSCPMDVSPQPGDDMDDMPDIGERSPSFRSRDERTSAQLGIIGVAPVPPPVLRLDDAERTVELEPDLQSLLQGSGTDQQDGDQPLPHLRKPASPAAAAANVDFTSHTFELPQEDCTVELEDNLDTLLQAVGDDASPAAPRAVLRPAPPKPTQPAVAAPVEDTVQLEADLNMLLNSANDDDVAPSGTGQAKPRRDESLSVMEMSVLDDSDEGTVEYDEEEAQEMRLSLESNEDSPHSHSETGQLSIGVAPPRRSPITFSLSFTGPSDSPASTSSKAEGIARFRLPSGANSPDEENENEEENFPATSSNDSLLQQSATTSLAGANLLDPSTTDSSPFSHIRVGRARSQNLAVSSSSSSSKPRRRSSRGASQTSDENGHTTSSQSFMPTTSSSEDGHLDSMSLSGPTDGATGSSGGRRSTGGQSLAMSSLTYPTEDVTQQDALTTEQEGEEEEPVITPLDYSEACRFQTQRAEQGLIQHLLSPQGSLASAPEHLRAAVACVFADSAAQMLSLLSQDGPPCDLEGLQQSLTTQVEALSSGSVARAVKLYERLQEALPLAAQMIHRQWHSLEAHMIQITRAKLDETVTALKENADGMQATVAQMETLQARLDEAKTAVEARIAEAKAQAARARVAAVQQRVAGGEAEVQQLFASRDAMKRKVRTMKALVSVEARRKAMEVLVQERDSAEQKLRALEERGSMLRLLCLAQPMDLQSDNLTFRYSHPNGSQTEVRMTLHDNRVAAVVVSNNGGASKRKGNTRARSLLHHVLQWPIFPDSECHPTKAGDSVWTWRVDVPCSQVKPALRRLEVVMGRTNLLVQMIMRLEESFTCSLSLGEQAVQREEQWVHDCLYGSSTTCPFEHDHGHSPQAAGSRLTRRCQPSALLPHCIGILTVQLKPRQPVSRSSAPRDRMTLKFMLSLSFLTALPAKVEPSLPKSGKGSELLCELGAFLHRRFGDSRAPSLGPLEGGMDTALVSACQRVEAALSQEA